jgi:3',5'-cyclic AMP phosphodiesterase CpdA
MKLLVLLFAAVTALPGQPAQFFLQMSDPQFGMYSQNQGFAQETANFEFAIATANRLRPAFVIVTGDMVNQPGAAGQVAEYQRIAATLDRSIPIHHVAGNHDVGGAPTAESLAFYRSRLGPDYYAFRSGDVAVFVLNSALIAGPDNVPEEAARQEAWLESELAKARAAGAGRLLVFQHHPLFLKDPGEPGQYFNVPLAARQRFLALFHNYGVSHVFAGHYHRNALARDGNLEMTTTGPVGKPLGAERSGMRVIAVTKAGVEHKYYDFGKLPSGL